MIIFRRYSKLKLAKSIVMYTLIFLSFFIVVCESNNNAKKDKVDYTKSMDIDLRTYLEEIYINYR